MSAQSVLTIVFRGLMVFHEDKENDLFEIGILDEPTHHIPRILTLKNGVLAAVTDLRPHDEPSPWSIVVKNPTKNGINIRRLGAEFVRTKHEFKDDFRWIMDLEDKEFYGRDLTSEIDTSLLTRVLRVSHGEFYTRLQSPRLGRSKDAHDPEEFGEVAAVVGCDIADNGEGATLRAGDGTDIFSFVNEPNTMYEIANTPPDIIGDDHRKSQAGRKHGHGREPHLVPDDHFQHYYELFKPNKPSPIFHLRAPDATPDPDPAVCGTIMFGKRVGSISK